jgi:hypothetical protein
MDDEDKKRLFAVLERIAENTQPPSRTRQILELSGQIVTVVSLLGLVLQAFDFWG